MRHSYGIFSPMHALVATCQLARSEAILEVGISVLPFFRRKGLAKALFGRSANHARARGLKALMIHGMVDNAAMLSLARHFGMILADRCELCESSPQPAPCALAGFAHRRGFRREDARAGGAHRR